jgi:hypothetical protein
LYAVLADLNRRELKQKYPNLAKELESHEGTLQVTSADGVDIVEKTTEHSFTGYVPTAIDYLRRCDDNEQAEKTINYLEKKGEINNEYANQLRRTLKECGLRSFGSKKEDDYYLKKGGYG